MRVLEWNVQGAVPMYGSKERIRDQVEYIDAEASLPDVLLLNEVTTARREMWHELLEGIGYTEIEDTLDWAAELGDSEVPPHQDIRHVNGNLTAIHDDGAGEALTRHRPSIRDGPWEGADRRGWNTNFPEKILNTTLEAGGQRIDLWNVRAVPGSGWGAEKIKILETVYARITTGTSQPCILAGDFNAPKEELADGTTVSWGSDREGTLGDRWTAAENNVLRGLEAIGMVDVFRSLHGYGELEVEDTSHRSRRFDHIIASEPLNPQRCSYDLTGTTCSDHAPLLATFDL